MALTSLARKLRHNPTDAEKKLWSRLRMRQLCGLKFRRQTPIQNYIVDFVCLEKKLVIELDGGQHADRVVQDNERTRVLESCGFLVLRFWNNEVLQNMESVLETITNTVTPHPTPPPEGEGKKGSLP